MAESQDRAGFVYVVQDASGLVKIGRTKNFESRLRSLTTASSSPLTLVALWPCDDAAEHEATKHEFWSDCRVHGEWFRIPEDVLTWWRELSGVHVPKEDDEDAWFELIHGKSEAR